MTQDEVPTAELLEIADAVARGFGGSRVERFGAVVRDLVRARGLSEVPCSVCGLNIVVSWEHVCDPKRRART